MLQIENLRVSVDGQKILRGLDLDVQSGTVHAIMGPNGSGKSTLASVLAGRDGYDIEAGSVQYRGEDLLEMDPEIRAREGIFLAFQYPVEVPGVSTMYFLREALNAVRKHRGLEELSAGEFLRYARQKIKPLGMEPGMLKRAVNEGFSGGEKKRSEIFQMSMLEPTLGILDETDSGLDIDALKIVAEGVNSLRSPERAFVVITHYQRLLNYIIPDYVHVLGDGRIVRSGDKSLALELERRGYTWIERGGRSGGPPWERRHASRCSERQPLPRAVQRVSAPNGGRARVAETAARTRHGAVPVNGGSDHSERGVQVHRSFGPCGRRTALDAGPPAARHGPADIRWPQRRNGSARRRPVSLLLRAARLASDVAAGGAAE